jgi:signal recognition particle GTPase
MEKEFADRAARQRDSMATIIHEQESSMDEFVNSYIEIQQDLATITEKGTSIERNMLKHDATVMKTELKKDINHSIAEIREMLKENKEKIAALNKKLKSSGKKNTQLEKLIASLNEQMVSKDEEIGLLNAQIDKLNQENDRLTASVNDLTTKSNEQSEVITSQTKNMHKAYYVVGKRKELEKEKIIARKGGVLGIGRTSTVSPALDKSKFTQIDYTETTAMTVDSKNAKVVSVHPADSYIIEKGEDSSTIVIKDPEKFWSASKYLVVVK